MSGRAVSGNAVSGEAMPGNAVSGVAVSGDAMSYKAEDREANPQITPPQFATFATFARDILRSRKYSTDICRSHRCGSSASNVRNGIAGGPAIQGIPSRDDGIPLRGSLLGIACSMSRLEIRARQMESLRGWSNPSDAPDTVTDSPRLAAALSSPLHNKRPACCMLTSAPPAPPPPPAPPAPPPPAPSPPAPSSSNSMVARLAAIGGAASQ